MLPFPKSRHALLGCAAAVTCLLVSLPAIAAPTFYSTGTHIIDGIDQDWLVSTGYGSFNTDNFVKAHIWPHSGESWITDAQTQQYQFFTFRQYFNLTGYDVLNADLKFYWGCDDLPQAGVTEPLFSINGGTFQGQGTCTGYAIGNTLVDLASGFVEGENYIDFRVQGNYATNGMGLTVVSFTAPLSDAGNGVPEPSTIALLGGALLGLCLRAGVHRKS